TRLPFQLYSIFVIEETHGFNNQTGILFFIDFFKSTILQIVISGPLIALFIYIIHWGGQNFYIHVWLFLLVIQLASLVVYPTFIQPLFDKITPLPDGELKTEIENLAKSTKFPLDKVYVIDGSTRSVHSNAYLYGLFSTKHIVLYDT